MASLQASCPDCRQAIPLADVNVATDVALCRKCEKAFSYATIIEQAQPVDLARPPPGARFERTLRGFEVSVSTRSPIAFFLVPFMAVWSGGSLSGLYGSQLVQGKFDAARSLFGLPFLFGTLLLGSVVLMSIVGHWQVTVDGDEGMVFAGVGPLGWRRRFNWREMKTVSVVEARSGRGGRSERLSLEGQTRLDLGAGLNEARRHYLLAVLRQMLRERR